MINSTLANFIAPKNYLKNYIAVLALFLGLLVSNLTFAQVSITTTTPITQNFNGLSSTAPVTWTNNTTPLVGWYATTATLNPNTGTTNSNNVYNCGTASATDRALGALSTTTTHNFGIRLKNNNANAITSLAVSFTGEQWRRQATAQTLVFEYQIGTTVTSITGGSWTAVTALDFTGPQTGTAIALDGNLTANRTALSNTITLSVPAGSEIMLRWTKAGSSSPLLAIDDLSITPSFVIPAIVSKAVTGDWSVGSNWVGEVAPTSANNAVIVSGAVITMNTTTGGINTRDLGTTTTVDAGGTLTTSVTYSNNGTTTINGSFQLDSGGWVDDAGGTNALVYGAAGTLIFNAGYTASNGNYWPTTSGPYNVTVNASSPLILQFDRTVTGTFASSSAVTNTNTLTVNGTCLINSTAATFSNPVVYGSSSSLVYNVNTTMGRGNEWNNSPANVTLQNNSVLNYPNGWGTFTRTLTGNLTVNSGSALYMDYGSPGSGVGLLTVQGNVVNAGDIALGNQVGGDLNIGGNFTNSGVLYPNSRAVTFNGSSVQSITGATTFDYLTLNNASGLTLNNSIINNLTVALTNGIITLGTNNLTVGSGGAITGASATSYIKTNNTGQLKRTVGASNVAFPVGNTAYNPITLNNSGTSDVYGIALYDGSVFTSLDATKTVSRRWAITEAVAGGSNLSVVAQYNTGEENTNFNAGTTPYLGFYNSATWSQVGATLGVSNPYTATSNSNSSPTDLTSGFQYFAIGKDNAFVSSATNLVITSISPATPGAGYPFSVTVQAQDAFAAAVNVIADTDFTLTTNGNAGSIGGTVTGTILAGTNTVVVTGVTLATAGTNANVTATRTAGDVLTAGTSADFDVLAAANHLEFVSVPATGNVGVNLTTFTVEARRPDNTVDIYYTPNIVIAKASGSGTLSGTLSVAPVAGVATFSTAQFDIADTYTLTTTSGSLTSATSGNIVISLLPVSIFSNPITGSSPGNTNPYTTNQTFDANISVGGIGRGSGINGTSGSDRYNTNTWTNTSTVIVTDEYFEMTLTPIVGYIINFSELEFTNQRSAAGPSTFAVRSSLDNYATDLGVYTNNATNVASTEMVNLSAVAFDNVSSQIIFRIYGYNSGTGTGSINDFDFKGNVICNNPTAYTVIGGGAYCSGGSGVAVGLANSQIGINYQLKIGGVDTGSPVAGTGAAISFGNQTTEGTYTVVASNTNSPCNYTNVAMTGSVDVSINTATAWLATAANTTWTDAGNWSCGIPFDSSNVTINAGTNQPVIASDVVINSLTINSTASLTVNSTFNLTVTDVIANAGILNVQSNANLLQTNNITNTGLGVTNVFRNSASIKRLDYTMWSSPVTGSQTLLNFSPLTDITRFYVYDSSTNKYDNIATPGSTTFDVATGYLIRMPNNAPTWATVWGGQFTGVPNNGDVPLTVANSTYYAIGNPYPSTIEADEFMTDNGITGALYFWRKTNNINQSTAPTTSYATYTFAGGTGTEANTAGGSSIVPNGIIQVGQGFIVKSTSTALNFTNSMRTANNDNQFLKSKGVERNRIWLNLTSEKGAFSQMMVAYMTGATQDVDAAIDGKYFNDSTMALNSYLNNEEYVIQGRALPFETTDVVPLVFKTEVAGSFTISIDHVDGLFTGNQDVFLKDKITGIETNLKTSNYTFTTEAGNFTGRFDITYQKTLSVNTTVFNENNIVVYKQNQDMIINTGTTTMSSVKVYDMRGRLLIEKDKINATQTKIKTDTTNEVLLVKITSSQNGTVTKKVIN